MHGLILHTVSTLSCQRCAVNHLTVVELLLRMLMLRLEIRYQIHRTYIQKECWRWADGDGDRLGAPQVISSISEIPSVFLVLSKVDS